MKNNISALLSGIITSSLIAAATYADSDGLNKPTKRRPDPGAAKAELEKIRAQDDAGIRDVVTGDPKWSKPAARVLPPTPIATFTVINGGKKDPEVCGLRVVNGGVVWKEKPRASQGGQGCRR